MLFQRLQTLFERLSKGYFQSFFWRNFYGNKIIIIKAILFEPRLAVKNILPNTWILDLNSKWGSQNPFQVWGPISSIYFEPFINFLVVGHSLYKIHYNVFGFLFSDFLFLLGLDLLKHIVSTYKTGRIFRIDFTLSNWPHFHSVNLIFTSCM